MAIYRASKQDREAERLRALREVNAPATSSDAQYGPFAIADAVVVLDLILTGWYDERDDDQSKLVGPGAWEEYIKLHAMRRTLLAHAARIEECEMHRTWLKGSSKSWRAVGIRNRRERTETHFNCLFCNDDLATIGRGSISTIAKPLMRKLRRHADECAMRFLLDSVLATLDDKR